VYHDFQHSGIDVENCDSTRTGTWCIVINDSDCMAAMLSAAVGPLAVGYGRCLCSLGDEHTEKQDDSQIDEANKNYLRNTDHF
jgi:hypothetical protein